MGLANSGNPSVWEVREPWKLLLTILEGIGKEIEHVLIQSLLYATWGTNRGKEMIFEVNTYPYEFSKKIIYL